jgi:hypothetical protein
MVTTSQTQGSESDWIREVIDFANSGKLGPALSKVPDANSEALGQFRSDLREILEVVATDSELAPEARKYLVRHAVGVTIRVVGIDPKDRQTILHYRSETVAAIASFLTLVMYRERSSNQEFPGGLRQCSHCKKFFFPSDYQEPKGGRPRTKYCSGKCRDQANPVSARVAKSRREGPKPKAAKHK